MKGGLWDTGYDPETWEGIPRQVWRGSLQAHLSRLDYAAARLWVTLGIGRLRRFLERVTPPSTPRHGR